MDLPTFNRLIWTSIESYGRWIEKAQTEIRSSYDLNSPSFQNNLYNLIDISERLMTDGAVFKSYPAVDKVERIAEEIMIGVELIAKRIQKDADRKIISAQLELLKRKIKELREVYARMVSEEQRKVA